MKIGQVHVRGEGGFADFAYTPFNFSKIRWVSNFEPPEQPDCPILATLQYPDLRMYVKILILSGYINLCYGSWSITEKWRFWEVHTAKRNFDLISHVVSRISLKWQFFTAKFSLNIFGKNVCRLIPWEKFEEKGKKVGILKSFPRLPQVCTYEFCWFHRFWVVQSKDLNYFLWAENDNFDTFTKLPMLEAGLHFIPDQAKFFWKLWKPLLALQKRDHTNVSQP